MSGTPMTMERLARLAGVAKVTVSRALNGSDLVREDTRARILQLAAEHKYFIHHTARSLSLQRTHVIAVVVEMEEASARPESEPYPLELLAGVSERANASGYNITLTTLQGWPQTRARGVDGVILLGQGAQGEAAGFDAGGLPSVIWGADDGGERPIVGGDDVQGGVIAAQRLVGLGKRTLVFVGDAKHPELAARLRGFTHALEAGPARLEAELACGFTFAAGFEVGQSLARSHAGVDGVFCGGGDVCAMGLVRALLEYGVAIPQEIAVVGYDDTLMSASFVPALTTVRQDWRRGGVRLAQKVLDQIEGRPTRSESVPVELRVRDT